MLFAASESAVTKKPRLRLMMRRSSSVSPFGSFHSWMSRLMLISCGIQWLAQAAMYFSQAHLYLKGTSWLTSALELMTFLSSTVTRRNSPSASGVWRAAGAATPDSMFSKLSMAALVFLHRLELGPVLARELAQHRAALRRAGARQLAGRDVQVPLGADDRQPLAVLRVTLDQVICRQISRLVKIQI